MSFHSPSTFCLMDTFCEYFSTIFSKALGNVSASINPPYFKKAFSDPMRRLPSRTTTFYRVDIALSESHFSPVAFVTFDGDLRGDSQIKFLNIFIFSQNIRFVSPNDPA